MRWAAPSNAGGSSAAPDATQTCIATTGAAWCSSITTRTPFGSVVSPRVSTPPMASGAAPSAPRTAGADRQPTRDVEDAAAASDAILSVTRESDSDLTSGGSLSDDTEEAGRECVA